MEIDEQTALQNFSDLVDKIVVKYNKGVVLDFVTRHSFQIINSSMEQLEKRFETIISAFEQIFRIQYRPCGRYVGANTVK